MARTRPADLLFRRSGVDVRLYKPELAHAKEPCARA